MQPPDDEQQVASAVHAPHKLAWGRKDPGRSGGRVSQPPTAAARPAPTGGAASKAPTLLSFWAARVVGAAGGRGGGRGVDTGAAGGDAYGLLMCHRVMQVCYLHLFGLACPGDMQEPPVSHSHVLQVLQQ
jgi:hypothetical protein